MLPTGVTFASSADCSEAGGTVTCVFLMLAPGNEQVMSFTVDVGASPPETISNTATAVGNEDDAVAANNQDNELTSTDVEAPQVILVNTDGDTGDGQLSECEAASVTLRQLLVTFTEEVYDPPGDSDPDDVTNILNYRLVATGPNFSFDTSSCGSVLYDDVALTIDEVTYDSGSKTATVSLAENLSSERYRFLVCGSTSIVDTSSNPLDGDGNGVGGDDYSITFRADPGNLLLNGHFDCDLGDWTLSNPTPNEITWANKDSNYSTVSGSAHIMQLAMDEEFSLVQCVPVRATVPYWFGSKIWVAADPGVSITATSQCEFYALPSCAGTSLGLVQNTQAVFATGVWLSSDGEIETPAATVSANCALKVTAPDGPDFEAWVDEVWLTIESQIFSDDFESGDTGAWQFTNP